MTSEPTPADNPRRRILGPTDTRTAGALGVMPRPRKLAGMFSRGGRLAPLAVALATLMLFPLAASATSGQSTASSAATRHPKLEKLAMRLLNCTRTGGWVRPDGSCKKWGSGKYSTYRRPLKRHKPISSKVAWPWAREMVKAGACSHTIDGLPSLSTRMKSAGYSYWNVGENIGCTWGFTLRRTIIWSHRAMQAERDAKGGHWRNRKNRSYKSVGIGVARLGNMTAIVFDFYGRKAP